MNTLTQAQRVRQCRQALVLSILAGVLLVTVGVFLSLGSGALALGGLVLSTLGFASSLTGALGLVWMKRNY